MHKHALLALLASLSLLAGCNANLVGQNNSAILGPSTPTYTGGGVPDPWFLYTDLLETGTWIKGLDFFSGGSFTGTPVIDLASTTQPDDGAYCWHFSVGAQTGSWFCGVILLQGTGFNDSAARPGVDITSGGFTKCVFRARSAQGNRQVAFKAFDNAANAITVTLGTHWQTCSIPLSNSSNMASMKQFFTIVLANAAPATATPIDLYLDDVRFQQ
jgi:hypothetical protein